MGCSPWNAAHRLIAAPYKLRNVMAPAKRAVLFEPFNLL
jgi:hypothetical protein